MVRASAGPLCCPASVHHSLTVRVVSPVILTFIAAPNWLLVKPCVLEGAKPAVASASSMEYLVRSASVPLKKAVWLLKEVAHVPCLDHSWDQKEEEAPLREGQYLSIVDSKAATEDGLNASLVHVQGYEPSLFSGHRPCRVKNCQSALHV